MTEGELQDYLETLSERELKDFQLADLQFEIARRKKHLIFSLINIALFVVLALRAYQLFPFLFSIGLGIVAIGFVVGAIRSYNYMQHETLQYKMLQLFFKENNI
jgi:hypothetical protein